MNYSHPLFALFSLMMVPAFAQGMAAPEPPEVGTEAVVQKPAPKADELNYPSNVGAVNEGGGSANTNGMNNGLSSNSSGSGTNASRAEDSSGFSFGGSGKPTGTAGTVDQGK